MAPVVLFVQQHKELGFDPSVYTKNRNFKCINQAKPNQPIQAFIEGDKEFSKHLIMHDFDYDSVNIADMEFPHLPTPSIKQKNGTPVGKLDLLAIPQQTLPGPENFARLTATPLDKLAMIPCPKRQSKDALQHDVMWRILVWCYRIGLTFEDYWAWARQREPGVLFYKKYQSAWQQCSKYHVSPSFVDKLLIRFYPTIQESKVTQNLRQHFILPEEVVLPGINGGFYNWRDISPPKMSPSDKKGNGKQRRLDEMMLLLETTLPKKFTILTGPMGSGKTEALINYLKLYGKGKRVLWLTPRITLSANTQKRLEEVGIHFVNYKTIDKKQKNEGYLDTQQYVICSIQSLHYLSTPFDIVIADEIETILSTFGGGATTHRNIGMNWIALGNIIEKANKVIVMDALTTKTTLNLIKGFIRKSSTAINEHLEVLNTSKPPSPRTFKILTSSKKAPPPFSAWMTLIYQALQVGKKLYIFTPFKRGEHGVDAVAQLLIKAFKWTEGHEIRTYYAEKEQEKRELCDANSIWGNPEVRCIDTNSAISVGVNFDLKDVFDQIFCLYSPVLPSRDFIQSLFRIRHPRNTNMITCLHSYEGSGSGAIGWIK
ncbi:hypothetical protein DFS34DRAFT_654724 [Phlyctochytrium arcticum]|nr:hypothetical protein DFS34DRAFT_654724 [Phlyctochytrium arcticum]